MLVIDPAQSSSFEVFLHEVFQFRLCAAQDNLEPCIPHRFQPVSTKALECETSDKCGAINVNKLNRFVDCPDDSETLQLKVTVD